MDADDTHRRHRAGSAPVIEYTELEDTDSGQWAVVTQGAMYALDLNARTGTRLPNDDHAALLRRDGQPFELLRLSTCVVGWPMAMYINLAVEGAPRTRRITTEVVSITRLSQQETAGEDNVA